jgi:hypothetical protein
MLLGYKLQFSSPFKQLQAIHQARTKELRLAWHDGSSRERLYLSAVSTSEYGQKEKQKINSSQYLVVADHN